MKRGLARAFTKFDAYQLAKYDRESVVKLRDVLFLCHAKPKDEAQAALCKKLVENTLEPPDSWEVAMSAGKDRRENFEGLLRQGKLGGLAVLRNLRLMLGSGVDPRLIRERLDAYPWLVGAHYRLHRCGGSGSRGITSPASRA